MIKENFHTHSTYCDGKSTLEEMIQSAIEKGFDALGFSGHSYMSFDTHYCMGIDGTELYKADVNALKEKYRDKLNIYLGLELDYYSPEFTGFDYTIGSVHYLKLGDGYYPVDSSAEKLILAADRFFDGSLIKLAVRYFEEVADVINKTKADVIGHFDLISKYNEGDKLFDSNDPRYVNAWKSAAEYLCTLGVPFEINTGAMSRGVRTTPYPTIPMAEFITEHGGTLVLNSDSHHRDTLDFGFDLAHEMFDRFGIVSFEEILKSKKG